MGELKFDIENDILVGVIGDNPPASMFGDADRQFRTMTFALPLVGDARLPPPAHSPCMVAVLEWITSLFIGVWGAECCRYEALWISPLLLLTVRVLMLSTVNWWMFEYDRVCWALWRGSLAARRWPPPQPLFNVLRRNGLLIERFDKRKLLKLTRRADVWPLSPANWLREWTWCDLARLRPTALPPSSVVHRKGRS